MSKQCNKNKKAHLFELGAEVPTANNVAGISSVATGTLGLADSVYTPFRDINNTDVNLLNPVDVSGLNNYDSLQAFNKTLKPQQVTFEDVGGHTSGQTWANIGKGAGAGASVGAGIGSFVGPIGTIIGAGIGTLAGGLTAGAAELFGKNKAKREQRKQQALANEKYNTQLGLVSNQANNINQNNLSDMLWNMDSHYGALGGNLHSNSTTWDTGLNYVGSGGSHESNPNDGVAISTAPDGLENKVEEGEVVWNDEYVFSKRLTIPEKDKKANKWKGKTYADVAKELMDNSEERPNDPITLRGLDDALSRLRDSQDELKAKQKERKIKKEIASMPPEMLAQLQQQAQQPTEEEMAQQAEMEQQQIPMLDQSMQQPMMEQPQLYAKGGGIKGGPGSWHHLSPNSEYDYAINRRPLAAIFDDVFQKNKSQRQPLVYKKKHLNDVVQQEVPINQLPYNPYEETMDYTLDEIENKINGRYRSTTYLDRNGNEIQYAKGGHLFPVGGPTRSEIWSWGSLTPRSNTNGLIASPTEQNPLALQLSNPSIDVNNVAAYRMGQNSAFRQQDLATRKAEHDALQKSLANEKFNWNPEYLRYASAFGPAIALALSARKPDYSNANKLADIGNGLRREISPKYTNIRMGLKPIDNSYSLNQLNAQQNAANDAIMQSANGNRSMAAALRLANDYSYNNQRGAMNRQDAEYNRNDEFRVNEFNNNNDKFDAQQYLMAESQNAQNRAASAAYLAEAAKLREAMDSDRLNAISANLSNLFNNIGAIGNDTFNANVASQVGDYGWKKATSGIGYKGAKGGYLTIKTNNRRKE